MIANSRSMKASHPGATTVAWAAVGRKGLPGARRPRLIGGGRRRGWRIGAAGRRRWAAAGAEPAFVSSLAVLL